MGSIMSGGGSGGGVGGWGNSGYGGGGGYRNGEINDNNEAKFAKLSQSILEDRIDRMGLGLVGDYDSGSYNGRRKWMGFGGVVEDRDDERDADRGGSGEERKEGGESGDNNREDRKWIEEENKEEKNALVEGL